MGILRIDLKNKRSVTEKLPEEWRVLGNRALTAKIMNQEVSPTAEPLGNHNKFILATGPLAHLPLSSASRFSIAAISPLTRGIKESNSGGICGQCLAKLGYRAVILENTATDWTLIRLGKDGVTFEDASPFEGLGTYELQERVQKEYGKEYAVVSIGPAGEMRLGSSAVFTTDAFGDPGGVCGRGGLGAVMGAKKIKAVLLHKEGSGGTEPSDKELFKKLRKEFTQLLLTTPQTAETYPKYGTASAVMAFQSKGGLPTRSFSEGTFEKAEDISGDALYELIKKRNREGKHTQPCMPGCVIQCYNVFPDKEGKRLVEPLQYETIAMLGSNIGISDLDEIAELNFLANDVGIDTIEFGVALGVAMYEGILDFGDTEKVKEILRGVPRRDYLSMIIASGATVTGRVFGSCRIPAVRGQGLPAHEPRAIKGMGVTFTKGAMGADHTIGVTFREKVDHAKPDGQVELSRKIQIGTAILEALGFCNFVGPAVGNRLDILAGLVNAVYGTEYTEEDLLRIGKEVMKDERDFNRKAGWSEANDDLPEFFREEPLPPYNLVYDVPKEEMDRFWDEL